MALSDPALPYGIRDVKVIPINSDGSLGSAVDLPAAQTLSFSEAEEFETLRGDDRDVAIHGKGPKVNWDLEAGGISLEAWEVMTGGTLSQTGSTPNQTKSLKKLVTESRPYFMIQGQSINDVDGDTHVTIFKAKVTDQLEGDFADGGFFITSCSGEGIGNANDELYEITWNETSSALTAGTNELQLIVSDATGGTFTITIAGETTSALAFDITAADMQTALIALATPVAGDLIVTGAAGAWYVEYAGNYGNTNWALLAIDDALATGGTVIATTIRDGAAAS